jgi:phage terminase large subunit-like protein
LNVIDLLSSEERTDYGQLESTEAKRLFLQAFFKRNFLAFVWLLGYRDLGRFHMEQINKIAEFRFIEGEKPVRRLWLWSRGFFKTSLITEAHTLWLIINNSNIRVLIVSFSLEVAKKPFSVLRNHLIGNEDFRYFFREFCPIPNKEGKIEFGTTEYFTIPNRTKSLKEPTVMCAGVGTNITGLHFDVQKIDDLVTKDSVSNDTQVQQSKDYFSLLGPIFDNPTCPRQDVIGTIYHFFDLHSVMLKNDKFSSSIIPVYNKNGVFAFPERISKDAFEKEILGDPNNNPYDIQSQYLLNPINPADAKFKEEWWKEYDELPTGLSEYVLCDPASTQKKKSDYTVIERWGVDSDLNFYLIDGVRDKLRANDRVSSYCRMAKQCKNLKGAKYEEIGGRQGDLENINDEFIRQKIHISVKPTKNTTATKVDRVEQRLVGQFHAGKIYMPKSIIHRSEFDGKSYDFVQQYKLEFLQFPFSEHDDILDCHSQLFDGEFIQKGETTKVAKEKDHFDWWRQQAIQSRKTHPRKRYIFGNKGKPHKGVIPFQEGFND